MESRTDIRDSLYIKGVWIPSVGSGTIPVIDPATEEPIGRIPQGTPEDVDRAVRAAKAAFPEWSQTSIEERATFLQHISERLQARTEQLAAVIAHEMGMPLHMARMMQVNVPVMIFSSMTPHVFEELALEEEIGNSLVIREPVGVVGCITPWNLPLYQIAAKVAPALAVGCTVVLKPSEVAPLNAFILAEVIDEVGLPAGVFNLVTGFGSAVGEALAAHPDVDMISFTGSTRAGRRVSQLAAQTVKRVALELGGKSPNIILNDAELDSAIQDGVGKCFLNSGQMCAALSRMLVPRLQLRDAEALAAEAAQSYTLGDPFAQGTRLGPLVSETQRDRVRAYIKKGIAEGAKLLTGGPETPEGLEKGYFVRPTVFSEVRSDITIAQEEIFGPVLAILPYEDEEDAIRIANDTIYGLAGGVWSNDHEHAKCVARRLRTGQVSVNGGPFNPRAPFGGYKQSGHGRELGRYGLQEFFEVKALQLPAADMPTLQGTHELRRRSEEARQPVGAQASARTRSFGVSR